ncbi:MAG: tRNA (adenosine(37)-N6)-threonylcarbamoyltransferase complex dimerization subunit type 1 TsaB [Actinomycetota bacterium]|nr:tRNA (adenosine(37)-N6)-threonylcarbamoyltransferase complex dimerization subunit type 1 TsaB [Rubrobacteraceae bacterium]MDQ3181986.1 tRNA (adenosine(37)-N6)-threonylcarbamoyltransferase complex dimerization subunit type 1 TsaB [Actinomycetota bacterium]MDQ3499005.1 tRNA (adenosine(37)-N6)-threonylcarbamoyltransferase complex dimerization subunit type 1 TsaB [Actinomycetota bacterium]MDQ3602542.1 tRNA (adenosine(37)-N6)-threonylcarbamoyltransferase complex dimerization subunit type 1 TsaB [A
MLILALDASTPVTTVALARENGHEVLAEVSVTARGASETLLPAIHAALYLAGEDLGTVEILLAGVGPGTFTGIRIAAATARALSAGTGIALSKNSSLDALAAPALSCSGDVLAVLDARRGQVFARRFSEAGPTTSIYCVRPEELSVEGGPLVVGDGALRYREDLSSLGHIPPEDSPLHRVTAVGHIISADLTSVNPEDLVPIYVREPDAEVRRDINPWSHP